MTDVAEFADVPEEIGEWEDSAQQRNTIKRGYAAFLDGTDPDQNPYIHHQGEPFSGFKRRKEVLWDAGWALAAVREGDYDSKIAVGEEHGLYIRGFPNVASKVRYRRPDMPDEKKSIDPDDDLFDEGYPPYLYSPNGLRFFETRHEAIGASVTERDRPRSPRRVRNWTRWVKVYELWRRPQLPPEEDGHV